MGKSPGKWIKSIIFGKKASSLSKERKLAKSASEKPVRVSSKESTSTVIVDRSLISGPVPRSDINITDNSVSENRDITKLRSDGLVSSSSTKQDGDISIVSDPSPPDVSEYMRLEQAATVVQASFRSNQVRCEFLKSRKGIIKLQAIVRGRLVRRQAVATFYCVQGIVKLQAIARGNMVRQSNTAKEQGRIQCVGSKDAKHGVSCKSSKSGTSLENAFVYKLLSPSPTVMPLHLQFGAGEPNSAWDWLHRWSMSQVWAPNPKQNETCNLKDEIVELKVSEPKCNGEKLPSTTVENSLKHGNSDTEKHKHNAKSISSCSVKSAQEHSRNGNDKVNRGPRKILKSTGVQAVVDVEKPKRSTRKLSKSPSPKILEQTANILLKPDEDSREVVSERMDMKSSSEDPGATSGGHQLNQSASNEQPEPVGDKSQDCFSIDKDIKDDEISCQSNKSSRRKTLPTKFDNQQSILESMKKGPSYMSTTASSKAKVRVQGSTRFGDDAVDKTGLVRRHSLPSSVHGKHGLSPGVQNIDQNSGRGIKLDRSLSSSRDVTDKVIRADWKR